MAQKAKQGKKSGKKRLLTLKQRRWLKNFIRTGNKAKSTREAGYNIGGKGGSKDKRRRQVNESAIGVQNYNKLKHIVDKILKSESVDEEWVKKQLIAEAASASQSRDRTNALVWLGKHFKMFTEKIEHTGKEKVIKIYIPDNKRGKDKPDKKKDSD